MFSKSVNRKTKSWKGNKMLKFAVNDNSPEAVEYRKGLIDGKKDDLMTRLNEEINRGPLSGYLQFREIRVKKNPWKDCWDVDFRCDQYRFFKIVGEQQMIHISFQLPNGNRYRTDNRVKAYRQYIALVLKKYSDELNKLRKELTFD